MLRIYLVRHAESEINVSPKLEKICGRCYDAPLTKKGVEQAVKLGERIAKNKIVFDEIYSSVAVRAFDTAKLACGDKKIITSDELVEQGQGDWDGLDRDKTYTPEVMKQMDSQHVNFSAPKGESLKQAGQRLFDFITKIRNSSTKDEKDSKKDRTIAIFSHQGAIKGLLHVMFDFKGEYVWLIGHNNTNITEIKIDNKGYHLVRLNDYSHL